MLIIPRRQDYSILEIGYQRMITGSMGPVVVDDGLIEEVELYLDEIQRLGIDPAPGYDDWLRMAFSFASPGRERPGIVPFGQ